METIKRNLDWEFELISCIQFLHNKGFAPATSSNYSFKPDYAGYFHVSVSGVDKAHFRKNHFMKVDMNGKAISDTRKPSAETLLHAMIYQKVPSAKCVLHTHTIYNTVLSMAYQKAGQLTLSGFEVLKGLQGINTHDTALKVPVFENNQNMAELAAEISPYWEKDPLFQGFLLAGHGLYTWGATIAEAKRQVEVFEFLFEVVYKLKSFSVDSLSNQN